MFNQKYIFQSITALKQSHFPQWFASETENLQELVDSLLRNQGLEIYQWYRLFSTCLKQKATPENLRIWLHLTQVYLLQEDSAIPPLDLACLEAADSQRIRNYIQSTASAQTHAELTLFYVWLLRGHQPHKALVFHLPAFYKFLLQKEAFSVWNVGLSKLGLEALYPHLTAHPKIWPGFIYLWGIYEELVSGMPELDFVEELLWVLEEEQTLEMAPDIQAKVAAFQTELLQRREKIPASTQARFAFQDHPFAMVQAESESYAYVPDSAISEEPEIEYVYHGMDDYDFYDGYA